ncbi:DNA (cytosine-5)-methyltransferase 3A-like [Rhopilema esculentum]|uniref:DNA (cytosine-5)-methyltransferase 3A-like n=1 Tax=Rhopilema esculentum TaxID=499914 RepID=UPI0031E0DE13
MSQIEMKRSAYEEWTALQDSAKDPTNWMWVPRRKCTVEKNTPDANHSTQPKDSISSELYRKGKKHNIVQKEQRTGSDVEAPCKRRLEFGNNETNLPEEDLPSKKSKDESPDDVDAKSENKLENISETGEQTVAETDGDSASPISSKNGDGLEQTPEPATSILPSTGPGVLENLKSEQEEDKSSQFTVKDMVFGKLKGYDWWPGLIITYREAMQRPPLENCFWVRWFGDHKVSEVLSSNLTQFFNFKDRFTPNRMRGIYKKGIREALELAAKRSSKIGLPVGGTKEAEDERLDTLIQWANESFAPLGIEGLTPKYVEEDDVSSSEDEVESDKAEKPKLDHHKEHPVKFYRNDNKDRFGKPMSNPILAEDVKALFNEVLDGKRSIESLCLACGDTKISIQHPLFDGGLCAECQEAFVEGSYLFDEDGSQMYCSICSDGKEVLMCDSPGCCRSYCGVCIDMLCGVGTTVKISSQENWVCFMCSGETIRLLKRRENWQERLREIFLTDEEDEYPPLSCVPVIPLKERQPLRVLALFDGLASGLVAMNHLDLEIEIYYASEIDYNANTVTKVKHCGNIKQLGDVKLITEKTIEDIGPFDLVLGGSPCNDLSIANPARKGIYEGTGRLFFEFFRILMYCRPPAGSKRPFFWLFENVVGMRHEDRKVISRFLQCNPVMIDAKDVSAQHRARYYWGNIPGMKRPAYPLPGDKLELQECLEPNSGRQARFNKVRTITTKSNSLKQTKEAVMPVEEMKDDGSSKEDVLWCTEVERLFGFPEHYTDVANMGRCHRQKLLGSAWSIPVLRHIFAPLKDYFKCSRMQK